MIWVPLVHGAVPYTDGVVRRRGSRISPGGAGADGASGGEVPGPATAPAAAIQASLSSDGRAGDALAGWGGNAERHRPPYRSAC